MVPTRESLKEVRYEIRGSLARRALDLEAQGRRLIKLNIGNPGAFGLMAPDHLKSALRDSLSHSQAYVHQQGLPAAREIVAVRHRARGGRGVTPERVFLGNGVSELIDLSLRALLNPGDEVLLPSPDYPLWTAATVLNDGVPVHYPCRRENGFEPDPSEVESRVTARSRALVLVNPNNPTGSSYSRATLEALVSIAARHKLLLLVDEIYEDILYDGATFEPLAPLAGDLPCLSFGGLSKIHRACGWRVGWAVLSGDPFKVADYHHAMDLLSALRLCANVPGQFAVEAALHGPDTITPLCQPGGRLYETRRAVVECCEASPYLELFRPQAAMYAFPRVVGPASEGFDDHEFAIDMLEGEGVLIVPGSSFNLSERSFFRLTLLPEPTLVREVFERMERVLHRYAVAKGRHRERSFAARA